MVTQKTSLQELVELAKKATQMVEADEAFTVRDLFTGVEWKRIPRALRTQLGSLFLRFVQSENPRTFEESGKTPQNQQIYRRVSEKA